MKKLVLILCVIGLVQPGLAQTKKATVVAPVSKTAIAKPTDEVLFTFGTDTVYRSEFERIYSKNNTTKEKPDEKSIKEYLDLYINFKLKVKEAIRLGLDTLPSFKSELAGYRKQLAQPYLIDQKVSQQLVKEAYERMKYEINASHILIRLDENALPKDTIAAYKKIMDLRAKIMKGESFDSIAAKFSEDPSAVSNYGNLGWFTAFQMIYQFETGAYTTEPGKISMPVRTRFGYHLIKVIDRRPASGEIKVAHIGIRVPSSATSEQQMEIKSRVDAIYAKLKQGEKFEDLVKQYSEDERTAPQKGELNWFSGTNNSFPQEFKDAAFALKENGSFSAPVRTSFGWHIIKRIDKRGLQPMAELEETIKSKIARDSRQDQNKRAVIDRIKRENSFTEFKPAFDELLKRIDSTVLGSSWDSSKAGGLKKPLFGIGKQTFSQYDFTAYVYNYQTNLAGKVSVTAAIKGMYDNFVDSKVLEYEEAGLDARFEDFRNLMKEYHDGILLFDLTDKKVWSKAVSDTTGQLAYYEKTKNKYLYKERYQVETFTCADEKTAVAVQKMIKAGKTNDEIKAKLNAKNPLAVDIKINLSEAGENAAVDSFVTANKPGGDVKMIKFMNPEAGNSKVFSVIRKTIPPQPKELKEVKGLVTSEYQNQLEKDWLIELRAKYPVQVNEITVSRLFK
ncbi:MAG: peptidylprolyl isomerase [Bacteroidia bacterium]|nr:peptidylprolyl isomerase [Bacteroidia bacterium]